MKLLYILCSWNTTIRLFIIVAGDWFISRIIHSCHLGHIFEDLVSNLLLVLIVTLHFGDDYMSKFLLVLSLPGCASVLTCHRIFLKAIGDSSFSLFFSSLELSKIYCTYLTTSNRSNHESYSNNRPVTAFEKCFDNTINQELKLTKPFLLMSKLTSNVKKKNTLAENKRVQFSSIENCQRIWKIFRRRMKQGYLILLLWKFKLLVDWKMNFWSRYLIFEWLKLVFFCYCSQIISNKMRSENFYTIHDHKSNVYNREF